MTEITEEKDVNSLSSECPITMRQLLEAGVHFGHQTKRWDPRMKPFIYTARNDIHVIDLQKSIEHIRFAYEKVREIIKAKGKVLFVGTKKQAKTAVVEQAERCGMSYVNQRWWGGTLTNHVTILKSIRLLKTIEEEEASGYLDKIPKKEAAIKRRKLAKLRHFTSGIKDMYKLPKLLIVVDTNKEKLAIAEAKKLGIMTIGIVDTNSNPEDVDVPIPGNDDAIRAVNLILSVLAEGVIHEKNALLEDQAAEKK